MSRKGLVIEDVFGVGSDPYANFEWEKRVVESKDGDKVIFRQEVEAPKHWSTNAVSTATTKYFRGNLGTPGREFSVKQVFNRVVDEIVKHGVARGVFDKASGKVFGNQIKYLLVLQAFSFNSPVYFNVGAEPNPQSAACFTLPVNDSLESIVEAQKMLVWIFSRGSGGGYNLSSLREMGALLSRGGIASGPLSFLTGFDAWGRIVRSGGVQRRAAMLARLDCWHPDIMEFITAKVKEEHKARALVKKGYSVEEAYATISLQNVNISVGLSDAFMRAAIENKDWALKSVLTGKTVKTEKAEKILNAIAENAHFCGDPGVQFDDTINRWNPLIKLARILGTNPCVAGSTKVYIKEGKKTVLKRVDQIKEGSAKILSYDFEKQKPVFAKATFLGKTRQNAKVVKLKTAAGEIRLTPDHEVMTNRGWVRAEDIQKEDKVYRVRDVGGAWGESGDSQTYPDRTSQAIVSGGDVEEIEVLGVEECGELEDVYDFNVPKHHAFFTENALVSNCAEFCAPPNHACNLASLNLTAFYSRVDGFLSSRFKEAVRFSIIAQDILVDLSGYPNQEITENARRYRPLGLGFTNLGGMFMNMGIPYDSDTARGWASIITGMMTASAFLASSELAKALGSFANYDDHRKAMLSILKTHKMKFASIVDQYGVQLPMVDEVEGLWEKAFATASKTGVRNCMVTLVAPAGTISHMMDCSTQGIEPILYVIAKKTLVGGGEMILFNPVIEEVLKNIGYSSQDRDILIKYVKEHGSFEGSPIKEQHLSIFDPAYPLKVGDRHVSIQGQMLMMAAVQPFISGAISKTFGLPETATAAEVREIILTAWKLGLKAVSVYRDKSKMSQPVVNALAGKGMLDDEKMRERLPDDTNARKHRVKIGGAKMYIIPSLYPDGRLGEVFINGLGMEGSTLSGMMDALLTAVSIGIQYGVPLDVYAEKFVGTSFPPKGFTSNRKIPSCTSLPDYVFRYLDMTYGDGTFCSQPEEDTPKTQGETTPSRPKNPSREINTGEVCGKCGWLAVRLGACLVCTNPTCSESKNGACG